MASPSDPALQNNGKFELPPTSFDTRIKGKGDGSVHKLDLKTVLPDLFATSTKVPRLVGRATRRVLDDMLTTDKGMYCHRDGGLVFEVCFDELPSSAGKSKIANAAAKINQTVESLKNSPDAGEAELAAEDPTKAAKVGGDDRLSRIIHQGLGANPTTEELTFWISRVTPNIRLSNQRFPMLKEMLELVQKAEIAYTPLWNSSSEAIVGGLTLFRSPIEVPQCNSGELMRQDLTTLFAAGAEAFRMSMKGEQGMLVIPLRTATLATAETRELIFAFLQKVAPELRKNMVFEIRGLTREQPSIALREAITTLGAMGRGVFADYGLLTYAAFDASLKLLAAGCDITTFERQGDDVSRLLAKFEEYYRKTGVRSYIKSVNKLTTIKAAKEVGFTYISGPAVAPPQRLCTTLRKLPFATLIAPKPAATPGA